jgi:hypothetical protein
MLMVYRAMLYLYPSAYREEYGEEMMTVFHEMQAEVVKRRFNARAVLYVREAGGLLLGALREHAQRMVHPDSGLKLPSMPSARRIAMRSQFRFPKATVPLMMVILVGVVMAIDKARAIQASIPYANPRVGPIQPTQLTVLPSLVLLLAAACVAGGVGWLILFALRRSGLHRFSAVDPSRD